MDRITTDKGWDQEKCKKKQQHVLEGTRGYTAAEKGRVSDININYVSKEVFAPNIRQLLSLV